MKLAIFYPTRVFYSSGEYTTDSPQFYQFLTLKQYFDEVDLLILLKQDANGGLRYPLDLQGYNVISLPFYRNGYEMYVKKLPDMVVTMTKLLLKHRRNWDAVLLFESWFPNQICYLLCKIFKIPVVLFVDGYLELSMWDRYSREKPLMKIIGWFLSKYHGFVTWHMIKHTTTVVDSKEMFDLFKEEPKKPYITVSTTIHLDDVQKAERIKRRDSKDSLNAITVCRVHPQKGLEYLVEAIGKAKEHGTSVQLNIVGPIDGDAYGNYVGLLKERIAQLGLSDDIKFTGSIGNRRELMKLYENADVFVLPSVNEGSPKVIPEAMACGLPIVATAVGSIPDLIEDGVEGILVKPRDVNGLGEALIRLANNQGLRHGMGEAALRKASEYTLEVQVGRFANIIKEAALKA